MTITVNLPDGSKANFPDGTSPDQMKAALSKKFSSQQQGSNQDQPDGALLSGAKGAAAGFGKMVLGAQELGGRGVQMVAPETGKAIVSDAEKGIDKLDDSMAADVKAHPWVSALAGLAGSSVGPMGAASKIAKAYNIVSPVARSILAGVADGVMQPVHVKGIQELDKSLTGYAKTKLEQIAAGAASGAVGGKIGSVLGPGKTKTLLDAGVKLTPGQLIGPAANVAEQKAMSVPVVGHFIHNARREAVESFNQASWNKALAPIGAKIPPDVKPGHDTVTAAHKIVDDAYDALLPRLSLRRDAQLSRDVGQAIADTARGTMTPDHKAMFTELIQNYIVPKFQNFRYMTGDGFKSIESDLSRLAARYRASPGAADKEYGEAVQNLRDVLRANITRQNPKYGPELSRINAAYAMYKPLQRASNGSTREGIFTPAQMLSALRNNDFSKDKLRFAKGVVPLQDLGEAANRVLGNHVPDSGTGGRLLQAKMIADTLGAGAASGSAAAGHATPLIAAAGASAIYTRPGTAAARALATRGGAPRALVGQAASTLGPEAVPTGDDQ